MGKMTKYTFDEFMDGDTQDMDDTRIDTRTLIGLNDHEHEELKAAQMD